MTQYGTQSPPTVGILPDGDPLAAHADRSLLIVDDDKPFSTRLARAMEARGYQVQVAESVAEGVSLVDAHPPAFAVIDMRLADGNGLDVIARLKERRPEARGVILTGYGNIATAVTAVKLGAFDYLAKPADADEIHGTLMAQPGERADPPENPMSADRVRWEHIQRVYELCNRNVSETARREARPGQALSVLGPAQKGCCA
jgi:two-component system response regulator RegA